MIFRSSRGVQRFAWRRSREVKRHGRMCVSNRRPKEHFCAKHGVAGFLRIAFLFADVRTARRGPKPSRRQRELSPTIAN